MTIIVFLIDTSGSMYQRAYLGGRPTLLDVAKGAVETFVKVRQRCPESRGDRYMLLTFEEPPNNIKAGWKENLATFMNELKNLQCYSMTTMGAALKHAFDVLNLNRMQTGIDTYGQGRCPFYLEPSVIVVITDGGKLTSANGVHEDFHLPMHSPIPGSELTREPFRWDQRLFALVLRLTGTPAVERDTGLVPSDSSPIDAMCEVTGGRSYSITSHRMLMQCIDSLVQKVQSGVVINFEKIGPDPPERTEESILEDAEKLDKDMDSQGSTQSDNSVSKALLCASLNTSSEAFMARLLAMSSSQILASMGTIWQSCRKLIYVPRSAQKGFAVGFWPIPESFWPDLSAATLPPRNAHPLVKYTCTSQEPMVIENLPFDKYELEPSPLTQYILARKQPTTCWQVFVANSYKSSEVGHPFGYLKASTNLTCVNLFVMPYNYPVLLPLLEELFKVHRLKPTNEWRTQFQNYMRTMPAYYAGPLRRALIRMGIPVALAQTLVPDQAENSLSYSVLNYLKRMKNQAKTDFDKLCSDVLNKQNGNVPSKQFAPTTYLNTENVVVPVKSIVQRDVVTHPDLQENFPLMREQFIDYINFMVGIQNGSYPLYQSYRNPFDIPRDRLLDQVIRMRSNFMHSTVAHTKLMDEDLMHSMPVNQMGNYQEYLKRQTPQLREIESAPVRQHMFGNPFKIDKRMMVDEADIDLVGGGGNNSVGSSKGLKRALQADAANSRSPNKRKPGPLPRELLVRKPLKDGAVMPVLTPPALTYLWSAVGGNILSNTAEFLPVTMNSETIVQYSESSFPIVMNGEHIIGSSPRSPSPTPPCEPFYSQNSEVQTVTLSIQSHHTQSLIPVSVDQVSPPDSPPDTDTESSLDEDTLRISEMLSDIPINAKQSIFKHNQQIKSIMLRNIRKPSRNPNSNPSLSRKRHG